jgi:hypothetical protein
MRVNKRKRNSEISLLKISYFFIVPESFYFFIIFYYYYSYVHIRLGSFLPPAPTPRKIVLKLEYPSQKTISQVWRQNKVLFRDSRTQDIDNSFNINERIILRHTLAKGKENPSKSSAKHWERKKYWITLVKAQYGVLSSGPWR